MREYTTPSLVTLRPQENLTDLVYANAQEKPDCAALSREVGGAWQDVTASQFAGEVTRLAKGLIAAGVQPGDRVGLLSRTRYEWTLVDFAILTVGGVVVPIYETSSADQIAWNLSDSGAVAVFLESAGHRKTYEQIADQLPAIQHVWQIDGGDLEFLADEGGDVPDEAVAQRRAAITGDTLATLIYTSGTTGRPKGCELLHRNFLFDARQCVAGLGDVLAEGTSTLLFLPLAHVLGRLIQYAVLSARVKLGHTADMSNLLPALASFQPTLVLSVPRIFEKVYNGAKTKAHSAGKGTIFDLADNVAVSYSRSLDGSGWLPGPLNVGPLSKVPNPLLLGQHLLFSQLVYSKIQQTLGGEVKYAISGGAPLGERLGHFFRGAGITVLEGYGLTETTAAATLNVPGTMRIGTVGRPIPGASARIAEDGEILLKGGHVFAGYWRNEEATRAVLEPDGWFHSGDLGEIDDDGFVKITGRKKEILVTAGGKNVSPAQLEDVIRAHPLISHCMVVGDARPFIAALITLDEEALEGWKSRNGKTAGSVAEIKDDPDLRAEIDAAVEAANKTVSKAESIRKYAILDSDFTEQGGQMTPTLKLKRNVVLNECAPEIDSLYA